MRERSARGSPPPLTAAFLLAFAPALALVAGLAQSAPVCVPLDATGGGEPAAAERCTEQQGRLLVQRSLSVSGELLDLRIFDEQGRLVRSETLAGGRRIKRVYYPGGLQLRSETDLLERDPGAAPGRQGVAREWAEGGQLTQETVWSSADVHSLTQWYLNGQVRLRQRSSRIGRHLWRTSETFHEDGQPASLSTERNGRLLGWQRYHDDAGRRLREDEHGERGELLQRRHYRPDGSLDREERFADDASLL